MKGQLVTPLKDFVKEFSQMVSYKNYTKKLFRVAEGQLLYNIEIKKKFFPCISKEGVKKTKPLLGKIKKGTVGKMFNIKCKAFLKYVEFLGEEKQEKPVRHNTMPYFRKSTGEGVHRANLLNCGEWRSGYFPEPYIKSAHREEMDQRFFSHETLTASIIPVSLPSIDSIYIYIVNTTSKARRSTSYSNYFLVQSRGVITYVSYSCLKKSSSMSTVAISSKWVRLKLTTGF